MLSDRTAAPWLGQSVLTLDFLPYILGQLKPKANSALNEKVLRLFIFGYASFFAMWAICEIAILIIACQNNALSIVHFQRGVGLTDFIHFYTAGQIASSANSVNSFNWQDQKYFFDKIVGQKFDFDFETQYSPVVYLIMVPFTKIPINQAHLLWDFLTTILSGFGLFYLARELGYLKKPITPVIILAILASEMTWINWAQGQIMLLYLGLTSLYIVGLFRHRNYVIGGIALAFLSIKPQYVFFLLSAPIAWRRYRLLTVAFIVELIIFLYCANIFSLQSLIAYPNFLHQCEIASSQVHAEAMVCIRSVLCIFFSKVLAYQISWNLYIIVLALSGLVTFYILREFKERRNIFIWAISFNILTSLLFSPHAHKHDLILLGIPALLILPSLEKKTDCLPVFKYIFFVLPLISWLFFFLGRPFLSYELGAFLWIFLTSILLVCTMAQIKSYLLIETIDDNVRSCLPSAADEGHNKVRNAKGSFYRLRALLIR